VRAVDTVSTTPADVFEGERDESTKSTVSGDGDGERGERERDESTKLSTVFGDGDGEREEREMSRQTCRLSTVSGDGDLQGHHIFWLSTT
jgi:hypothetical protein